MGTDAFFPERGVSTAAATTVCEGSEVRRECFEAALAVEEDCQGVWGGLSRKGRRQVRRSNAA